MAFGAKPGFKPVINPIIFWAIIVIILVIIIISGFFLSESCVDISGCKACWSNIDRTKQSDICPENQSCTIDAYVDQHNAVTSALLCACNKANVNSDYPNIALNNRIVDVYNSIYGTRPSVQEICDSGGLVRIRY
ncbi:MAG: hypothetical protein V1870_03710 [Candidatus Aenigmatarchaeota archaeon]